jgi:hypothetical protein
VGEDVKDTDGRYPSRYRFSARTIRVLRRVFIITLIVGLAGGIGFGVIASGIVGGTPPAWAQAISFSLIGIGIVVPIGGGAVFGGEAIMRFGGFVGGLFAFGLIAVAFGTTFGLRLLFWLAIAALVFSVVLFFVIGHLAKVPMWIQLPFFGSPRTYVSGARPAPPKPNARTRRPPTDQ